MCLEESPALQSKSVLSRAVMLMLIPSQMMQVLNAMLLACCSEDANPKDNSLAALKAIQSLLDAGAVPDTWAPNGNSVQN